MQGKPTETTETEEPCKGKARLSGEAGRRLTEAEERLRREQLRDQAREPGVKVEGPAVNDWGDWQPPAEVETPLTDRLMNWAKQSATGRRARYGQASEREVN